MPTRSAITCPRVAGSVESCIRLFVVLVKVSAAAPISSNGNLGFSRRAPRSAPATVPIAMIGTVNGDLTRLGLPKPDHLALASRPIMNTQILHHLAHGDIAATNPTNSPYHSGNELGIDFAAGWNFSPKFELGITGYVYDQTTRDKLTAPLAEGWRIRPDWRTPWPCTAWSKAVGILAIRRLNVPIAVPSRAAPAIAAAPVRERQTGARRSIEPR